MARYLMLSNKEVAKLKDQTKGLVKLGDEDAKRIEQANAQMDNLGGKWDDMTTKMASAAAPAITEVVKALGDFFDAHSDDIAAFAKWFAEIAASAAKLAGEALPKMLKLIIDIGKAFKEWGEKAWKFIESGLIYMFGEGDEAYQKAEGVMKPKKRKKMPWEEGYQGSNVINLDEHRRRQGATSNTNNDNTKNLQVTNNFNMNGTNSKQMATDAYNKFNEGLNTSTATSKSN